MQQQGQYKTRQLDENLSPVRRRLTIKMTDFVQKTHRAPYEGINPRLPNLSQQGRTVLVTGGSSGIGFAIARAFALADADRVIILGRREAAVTEAVSSLRSELPSSFQGQISGRVCDISEQAHIDDLWDQLARDHVDVDVVVLNAASFSQAKPVLDLGVDTLLDDYRVNVLAGYRFVQRLSRQNASKKKVCPYASSTYASTVERFFH